MASIFRAVSSSDSPFFVEDVNDEKDMMSAESRLQPTKNSVLFELSFQKKPKRWFFLEVLEPFLYLVCLRQEMTLLFGESSLRFQAITDERIVNLSWF